VGDVQVHAGAQRARDVVVNSLPNEVVAEGKAQALFVQDATVEGLPQSGGEPTALRPDTSERSWTEKLVPRIEAVRRRSWAGLERKLISSRTVSLTAEGRATPSISAVVADVEIDPVARNPLTSSLM
jgi:hypothetical protein